MSDRQIITARRLAVLAIPIAAAILTHAVLAPIFSTGIQSRWWMVAVGFVAICFCLSFTAIAGMLNLRRLDRAVMIGGIALSGLLIEVSWPVIFGGLLEAAAIWTLLHHVGRDANDRIRPSVIRSMAHGLFGSLVLFIAALSFFSYTGLSAHAVSGRLQDSLVESGVVALNRSLPLVYHEYRPPMTVDELIRRQLPTTDDLLQGFDLRQIEGPQRNELEGRLRDAGLDPASLNLEQLSARSTVEAEQLRRQLEQAVSEAQSAAVVEVREQLGETFDVMITDQTFVEDVLRMILRQRLDRLTDPHQRWLPPILAASVFFSLLVFLWAFTLVTNGLAWFGLTVMVHTGLLRPVRQHVEVLRYTADVPGQG